jgi:hypothetical protein
MIISPLAVLVSLFGQPFLRQLMIAGLWFVFLTFHPSAHVIRSWLLESVQETKLDKSLIDTVKAIGNNMMSPKKSQMRRNIIICENQRWWIGTGYTPTFILNGK